MRVAMFDARDYEASELVSVSLTAYQAPALCQSEPYRIVPYRAEHKELVAELARHELWSPDVRLNASYLEWKYHRNPYIGEPLIYLAFSGDRLVGMRGASGSKWEIGDPPEVFILPYPDDLVVDPAHRVQGLHRRIMEFALKDLRRRGFRYVVNLSASKVTALGSLRMNWRSAGSVNPVHRRTRCRRATDHLADRLRRWRFLWRWTDNLSAFCGPSADRLFDRLEARLSAASRSRPNGSLFVKAAPLAREMAELVKRLPRDGRIRHIRDEAYFDWRFANPTRSYRFIYAAGARLEGYLVLQRSLGYVRHRVCIVDWEAENDQVREELLAATVACGDFPELYAWAAANPPSAGPMFDRYGFEQARSPLPSILVRSLDDKELNDPWSLGERCLDDAHSWDLRMINSMQG
jgi:GNAT superfamily N-acetyltransferase